jgi:uncharacterized protein
MRAWFVLLLGVGFAVARPAMAGAPEPLVIETADGLRTFMVEVATTPGERARGLMFREQLAPDAGMLFVYAQDQPVSMWMKNTLIPLDMLFVARDGRILKIVERTVPLSTAVIASDGSVAAVLELNGGTADRLGLRPGDRVRHASLGGAD